MNEAQQRHSKTVICTRCKGTGKHPKAVAAWCADCLGIGHLTAADQLRLIRHPNH